MAEESKLDRIQKQADEIGEHLKLKTHQVHDEFETQKNNLRKWVSQKQAELDKMGDKSDHHVKTVKGDLEHLNMQLSLGKAEGKEAFLEQKKNIEHSMSVLEKSLENTAHQTDDKWAHFKADLEDEMSHFNSKLDVFRLHLTLGKQELETVLEERKKQLTRKFGEFKSKFEVGVDDTSEKLSGAWNKFKKALGGSDESNHDQKTVGK